MVKHPDIVTEAVANGENLYYFGLGSNMLRSRLENRAEKKIEYLSMEPALVKDHRLAFNFRAILPLEPAMAAIESTTKPDASTPLYAYEKKECHGALILVTAETYIRIMESEGVSSKYPHPAYEEVVVTAYPYNAPDKPVQALTLRARPHVRLAVDAAPSMRYMNILREGAAELGLTKCYQDFLNQHPVQPLPAMWLRRIAMENMLCVFVVSFKLKWRFIANAQSRLLYQLYSPTPRTGLSGVFCDVATAMILLPGAMLGSTRLLFGKKDLPPFLKKIIVSTKDLEKIDDNAKKTS